MLFEKYMWLKCRMLVEGCSVLEETQFENIKRIHLYSHSSHKTPKDIPDDILFCDAPVSARVRYNPDAALQIRKNSLYDQDSGESYPITFPKAVLEPSLAKHCSVLGTDVLGIIPSNYCFYFQDGSQCRFCEILPTFKKEVNYNKSFKSAELIESLVSESFDKHSYLEHIAITTGNLKSYDWTYEYFKEIGSKIKHGNHVLATLMPPSDLSLLPLLKDTAFNKIYFPLEVFEPGHFEVMCPGKYSFGRDKILEALDRAVDIFGPGNVYTNFVYGIQSLNSQLDPKSFCPDRENDLALEATEKMLKRNVIPAFTLYHYGGYNRIGKIQLSSLNTMEFFKQWGELVSESQLVQHDAVLFNQTSLTNTLFNDGYYLAKEKLICT